MNKIQKYFGRLWVSVIWTLIILVLMTLPGTVMPKEQGFTIPHFDKFVHFVLFGGFVFLWCHYYAARHVELRPRAKFFFFIFILACAYGIGMEYVQKYFIPLRDYDEADIIADILGAGVGYGRSNIRLLSR